VQDSNGEENLAIRGDLVQSLVFDTHFPRTIILGTMMIGDPQGEVLG
jgi:hypothetical protein